MFRVHQFDKVEMFSFVTPETSWDEHEFLVSVEEEVLGKLEIPYRVVNVAAGDLGGAAAKKYDIEVWLPGQERYRELTSCSNTTDYQARRLQTRVRRADGGTEILHTLNGTATAIGRALIAILENHQQADGSVVDPRTPLAVPARTGAHPPAGRLACTCSACDAAPRRDAVRSRRGSRRATAAGSPRGRSRERRRRGPSGSSRPAARPDTPRPIGSARWAAATIARSSGWIQRVRDSPSARSVAGSTPSNSRICGPTNRSR